MKKLDRNNIEEILALTPVQEGMLFHYLKEPDSDYYFEQLCLDIAGAIDTGLFERAWNFVIDINEILRTVFRWEKIKNPNQVILKKQPLQWSFYDFADMAPDEKAQHLEDIKSQDRQNRFDLQEVPFRVTLCKTGSERHFMIVSFHHMLLDGWSTGIVLKEFLKAYAGLEAGIGPAKPHKTPFKEFIKWRRPGDPEKEEKNWQNYLAGVEPVVLSIKKEHTVNESFIPGNTRVCFDAAQTGRLEQFVATNRLTLAALFYCAWGILLQQYNNTDDAIFGTTVSGRPPQLEGSAEMVGLFINTIPLRIRFFTDENLLDLLHRVQISLLDREPFEHSSLLKIREYCHLKSNETLFDSIVALENYPLDAALSEGTDNRLAILSYAMIEATHYDLSLGITLFKEIQCHFQYRKEILEEEAVRRLAGYFTRIVEELVEKPFNKVIQIEILSEEEKKRLLIDFNDTAADYPGTKTVPGLFAEQLERTPDRIALVGADSQICPQTCPIALSYNELNRQSDRLAGLLIEKGARPGTIVGIMMKRSPGLITGIFGILKTGGAYLPIDPEYPQERVDYMLKDSGAKILITDDEKKKMINCQLLIFNYELLMGNSEVFFHHSSFIIHHSKPSLAYIIYTSGSTGKPKGVLVAHRSLVNLCVWHNRVFEVKEKDRASQYASPGFDASVWEIFPYLLKGAALYIINDELKLDMFGLNHYFEMHHITLAFLPTQICEQFMQVSNRSLRILLTGGDKLHMFTPRSYILYNNYGPTEGTVVTSSYRVENWSYNIPIGRPTANNHIYILHKNGITLQPIGVPGELYIAGAGLALGYLNNIELTAGRFKFNRSYGSYRAYISYHTGDLARWLHDGNIEYLGRIDQQVKIRGFRIELGEIENGLRSHPGINEAVVLAEKNAEGEHCLRAYIVGDPGSSAQLKEYLSRLLPAYMIPAHFQAVQNIPLTPSGKIDRRALASSGETLNPGTEYIAPQSAVEKTIAQVWRDVLGVENVGIHDQFFDRGGNSVSIIRLSSRLSQVLKKNIPVATLFNHPTIASLVDYLVPPTVKKGPTDTGSDSPKNFHPIEIDETVEIAVIGMAGRFPGAKNIDRFWENLKNGVEGITFFSREELQEMDVNPAWLDNPDYVYVPAKGVLPGHDRFDAYFFGYTPAEARIMDPQVRIFHECVWEALENAGYDPGTYGGAIGLFAGASPNPFWEVLPLRSMGSGDGKDYPGLWNAIQFSDKDYLSTRVAYKLDLRGPCVTLQTACSTSLTAVDQACRNLLGRACHIALAGGVSVTLHDEAGYLYQEGTIMSPDGHCRAFDSRAQGTVGGNGAGVVVLKRLREAIDDGDRIMAVIKGLGISNDGKNKVGFTAPSSEGQAVAIRAAVNMAGFSTQSIGYIETHGTGTPLGDPIEIEGLKKAFNTSFTRQTKSCAIGSVKTNIGHLDAAAGIAGFIKTILTLYHRMIPPSLNFERPNPALDLENSPFYVNTVLKTWERCEFPLRAGVSAFGLGGTNVHVVLEEYAPGGQEPFYKKVRHFGPPKIFYYLMSLSAATPNALEQITANLAHYFEQNPGIDPADAAYTLQVGRKAFKYRRMLVCSNLQDAVQRIAAGEMESGAAAAEKPTIIFMFSGQGSQYVNMGLDLYRYEPVFRDLIDQCFEKLEKITGLDMKAVLYPTTDQEELAEERIYQFRYTTPIKFIFEYALARLLMTWGIRPSAMIGHSFGEYVAACLAGVFSLEDGLHLAALRGEAMHSLPGGAMLSVPLCESELIPLLNDQLSLATVDAPSLSVVSGPVDAIEAFADQLNEMGHECIRFRVPRAGHSWMVEPIMPDFKKKISGKIFNKPTIPYISGMTGQWISAAEATDPDYWVRHLRATVRFADGLTTLFKEPNPVFLQVGPGKGLTMFVNRHPDMKPGIPTFNMLRHPKEETTDICYILSQVGRLWMLGVEIDWPAFHAGEKRRRIALPTYPFEGNIYPVAKNLFKLDATSTQPVTCDSQLSLDGAVQPTQTIQPTRPARPHLDVPYRDPANPIEKTLAKIWLDLLGYDRIGTRDNFFALNGDSLKAVIAISTIHKELGVKVPLTEFFALSTIGGLAQYISARKKHSSVARDIPPVEKREYYPLSPAQKRMFILNRMAQDSIAYNITSLIELHGEVDREKFQEIFRRVIQRHESLRTSFTVIDEEPVQRIHDTVEFEIEPLEIKNLRSFDLSKAPLLRVGLIQEDAGKYILLVDMHHIISDGTSMGVLVKDFMQLFKEEPVAPLTVQYKDYAYMRQNERNTERWQQQAVYWRRQLAGVLPVLNLTTDFPRPPEWDFAGRQSGFVLEKAETAALKALARTEDVTLYMVLLSIYTIMLARLAGQEELPVGAPMAGRGHVDTLPIIGMFINTLVLRCFPVMEKTYRDYLLELKTVVLAGLENQDYPFEDVVEEMVLSREAGRNPLFDVAFVLQNMDVPEIEIRDLKLIPHLFDSGVAKFDMALIVEELNDTLRFTFEYRTSLFTPETMVRLGHFFKQISSAAVADTLQKVGSIDMLSLEEKTKLLEEFNCTGAIIPEATLPDLFQQQVERTPDRVALVGADGGEEKKRRREEEKKSGVETLRATSLQITYFELNKQSDRLADLLIQKGVLPDTIVGIMMERSIDLIIGILGILKAGGAYMPIDPEYPEERIDYMLKDSGTAFLLTDYEKKKRTNCQLSIVNCQLSTGQLQMPFHYSNQLAYVIYTSGSTGKPKGVMVNHRSLVNLCSWYHRYFEVTVNDRASQYTSPGFDASIWEIFPHLLNGAALYMIHNEIKLDIFALNRYFEIHCITTAFLPTQVCEQFMQISTCPLRILHAGGDKLHQFTPRSYKLYNIYGPTENTVAATFFPVEKWSPNISIGRPIANNYIYILNKNGKTLQPIGVPGELYIGGDGLARGYLNKPELTAEKFIDFHHSSFIIHHSNLYCTGDLAKWLPDGNIEFLGRIDYQVKIRGFRIELGEIENRLLSFKGINEAAILVKEDGNGNKYLCAYVVSEGKVNDSEWQAYLRAYLPDYMVPSHFVQLEQMPLTTNGKIDRASLLEIDASTGNGNMSIYEPPADETERTLVKIWADVLGLKEKEIGVHDDFFRLGGHSLRAMGLAGKIKKTFSVEIPLAVLFKTPYIRGLAAYIRQSTGIAYCDIGPVEKKEYYALSPAQQRLYFLDRFETVGTGYHIPAVLEVSGTPNKERFEESFRSLIRRHESLRTAFLTIDGNPVQDVYPVEEVPFFIEYRDKTSDGGSPADVEALMWDFVRPFDLSRPPLLRVCLVKIDRTTHLLLFDMHHIISDGTSMGILIREFTALYNGSALAPLYIQYKDFSEWQNNAITTGKTVKEEEYWLNLYAGEIPRLELPTDYPRPEVFDFKGETLEFNLDHPTSGAFKELCASQGITLYMGLLTVFNMLLGRYSGQEDIIVGSGIAGRNHDDLRNMIGLFVNMLVMRNYPAAEKTVRGFMEEVRENTLKAFENETMQFEDLVRRLEIERDPSRNPLFDVCIVVQNFEQSELHAEDITFKPYPLKNNTAKFDITLFTWETGDNISFSMEYCTGLFSPGTMDRMKEHFLNIIGQLANRPGVTLNMTIGELDILSETEKQRLLYEFNEPGIDFPRDKTIHELFAEQVKRTADGIVLINQGAFLSYRQLNEQADRVAAYLHAGPHIQTNDLAVILMDNSAELIIAILGVLKAGAAYLPVDPSLPEERIKHIIDDATVKVVLSQKRFLRTLNRLQWECPSFHTFLCLDSMDIEAEQETEKSSLMDKELWEFVGNRAKDDIEGGGWLSSYTGEAISAAEMDEYGDNALKKLTPLLDEQMRVLEIGCASGITMYRVAPRVAYYLGTDLSGSIIEKNKERVNREGHRNIALSCLAAHEIETLQSQEEPFDLIIINSVIQTFHGHNYLRHVIKMCIDLLGEKGYLFIGDVMDQQMKKELTRELLEFQRANREKHYKTKTDFSQELFISREFFQDLAVDMPEIENVEFSTKIHTTANELTKFRYDTLITIAKGHENKKTGKHKYREDSRVFKQYGVGSTATGVTAGNPAYVIYTSGSTGRPKGVMVNHRSLANLCGWHNRHFAITPFDRATKYAGLGFDASVWEIFPYIIAGAGIYIIADEIRLEVEKLKNCFDVHGITISFLPTQVCEQFMLNVSSPGSLRFLLTGGDKLQRFVKRNYRLINNYGPTENTVVTTSGEIDENSYRIGIPIGKPISNNQVYILDKRNRLQPLGAAGELCIGGESLAAGYLNNPELTAEKFYRSYRSYRSYIFYKTGDLVKWLPDGNIRFLGRVDTQVKIRGYRIEPGEVENLLLARDDMGAAVVIISGGDDRYLCAYYVVSKNVTGPVDAGELKAYLAGKLPGYMIPRYFVPIEKIPLTSNGKVDRKMLPDPGKDENGTARQGYVAPSNEIEEKLSRLWQEVLGIRQPGINDNFFDLGGDSIKAIQVTARLRQYGLELKISDLFLNPTIKGSALNVKEIEPVDRQENDEIQVYAGISSAILDEFEDEFRDID